MTNREAFAQGLRDVAPIIVGFLPFGMMVGIAASKAGLGLAEAVGQSVVVYAGVAQLAAWTLFAKNTPWPLVALTAFVINLRLLMYSTAMAKHFSGVVGWRKWLGAYSLTDHGFAMTERFAQTPNNPPWPYYVAISAPSWLAWQTATVLGIVLGAGVPKAWQLEFAIPLSFVAIVAPALKTSPQVVACLAATLCAVLLAWLPLNLGLFVAALAGIVAGVIAENAQRKPA